VFQGIQNDCSRPSVRVASEGFGILSELPGGSVNDLASRRRKEERNQASHCTMIAPPDPDPHSADPAPADAGQSPS